MSSGASSLVSLYAAMAPAPAAAVVDVDRILSEAYARGVADGEAAATAALAPDRSLLANLGAALTAATAIDIETLRQPFAALVTAVAEAVVMAELALSPAIIERLVEAALASAVAEPATVRLHPDDITSADDCPVRILADPELARGSVAVEGPAFVVYDGLAARLATLLASL